MRIRAASAIWRTSADGRPAADEHRAAGGSRRVQRAVKGACVVAVDVAQRRPERPIRPGVASSSEIAAISVRLAAVFATTCHGLGLGERSAHRAPAANWKPGCRCAAMIASRAGSWRRACFGRMPRPARFAN